MSDNYEREYNMALIEIRRLRNLVDNLEQENKDLHQLAIDYDWYLRWEPRCHDEDDAKYNLRCELDRRIVSVRDKI